MTILGNDMTIVQIFLTYNHSLPIQSVAEQDHTQTLYLLGQDLQKKKQDWYINTLLGNKQIINNLKLNA